MKKIGYLLLLMLLSKGLYAQRVGDTIDYGDTTLNSLLKSYINIEKAKKGKRVRPVDTTIVVPDNVSDRAFRDTVYNIFSTFVTGETVSAKNSTGITAEIASDETRFNYNIQFPRSSRYTSRGIPIFNLGLWASGKDNVANLFKESKGQGNFGLNLSGSWFLGSSLFYNKSDGDTLQKMRQDYFWLLKAKGKLQSDTAKRTRINNSIKLLKRDSLYKIDTSQHTDSLQKYYKRVSAAYARIKVLSDSVAKIISPDSLKDFYETEIAAFEKENAVWTGFSIKTIDLILGVSSEGFNYYQMSGGENPYPIVSENAKRFARFNLGLAYNWIRSGPRVSNKFSLAGTLKRVIGFDNASPEDITQTEHYDSTNATSTIKTTYSAYKWREDLMKTYWGGGLSLSDQIFFGKTKSVGLGFSGTVRKDFGGVNKKYFIIDNTYSFLIALSKKGDPLNKNVIAFNLTTPDLGGTLADSKDKMTGEKLRMKDKMTIGVTFGLTLESLLFKKSGKG